MSVKGVLRAVGALVGFYVAVLAVAFPMLVAVVLILDDGVLSAGVSFASLALAALVVYVLWWKLGWATEQMFGWPGAGWRGARLPFRAFGFGAVIGGLMAAGALTLAVTAGSAQVSFTGEPLAGFVVTAGSLALLLLVAALAEELLFRGYPLARLSAVLGKVGASIALAIVFALAHLFNPNVSTLGLVNIGLAALVLSAAFFTPGGLAAAWGLHWGWNAGLGLLADAPVSGLQFDLPALDFSTGEPVWLTGGRFGPEGGLVATVAMVVVLVWLTRNDAQTTEDHS
jgi:hypothetical protein